MLTFIYCSESLFTHFFFMNVPKGSTTIVWCNKVKTYASESVFSRPARRKKGIVSYTNRCGIQKPEGQRREIFLSHFRLIRTFGSAVKYVVKRPQNGLIHQLPAGCRSIFHQEQAETQSSLVANRCTRSEQRVLGH